MEENTRLLADVIARHFEGARIDGDDVDLGFAGLHLRCSVTDVRRGGGWASASLFFHLHGGSTGSPVFLSCSGYGDDEQRAIVIGACNWACTFGPVLRAAYGGRPITRGPAEDEPARLVATLDGQPFDVFVNGLDRVLGTSTDPVDVGEVRRGLGATPWLITPVLAGQPVPLLDPVAPTVIGVFVGESREHRTVEVKVNGTDWPPAQRVFSEIPNAPLDGIAMLREVAILVPRPGASVHLARSPIERTLSGLTEPIHGETRAHVRWLGWERHGGRLAPPLSEAVVAEVERALGPLPADYRRFLLEVAECGAGPGYGLVSPRHQGQRALARGTFPFTDGQSTDAAAAGAIALAHAGCGVVWLLVLEGPHRGEVWVDAVGSDGIARRVAPSFEAWYRQWLDASVRDIAPWVQWDGGCCALPKILSQCLETRTGAAAELDAREYFAKSPPRSVTIVAGSGPYFGAHSVVDNCQSCTELARRLGVPSDTFARGADLFGTVVPSPALEPASTVDAPESPAPRVPWWRRWFG